MPSKTKILNSRSRPNLSLTLLITVMPIWNLGCCEKFTFQPSPTCVTNLRRPHPLTINKPTSTFVLNVCFTVILLRSSRPIQSDMNRYRNRQMKTMLYKTMLEESHTLNNTLNETWHYPPPPLYSCIASEKKSRFIQFLTLQNAISTYSQTSTS